MSTAIIPENSGHTETGPTQSPSTSLETRDTQEQGNTAAFDALNNLTDSEEVINNRIKAAEQLGEKLETFLGKLRFDKDIGYFFGQTRDDEDMLRLAYWRLVANTQSYDKTDGSTNNFRELARYTGHFNSYNSLARARRGIIEVVNRLIKKNPGEASWQDILTTPELRELFREHIRPSLAVKDEDEGTHTDTNEENKEDETLTFSLEDTLVSSPGSSNKTNDFAKRIGITPGTFKKLVGVKLDAPEIELENAVRSLQERIFDYAQKTKNLQLLNYVGADRETFVDGIVGQKTWSAIKYVKRNKLL